MWLWVGISVSDELKDIRNRCVHIASCNNMDLATYELEPHISLKMSFEVNQEFDNIVKDLEQLLSKRSGLKIDVSGVEYYDNIVWLKMINNQEIDNLHTDICNLIHNKYHIELHEYDLDFLFHSTLFMDINKEKIFNAYNEIKKEKIPTSFEVKTFLIGYSLSGENGTYKVLKRI